MVFRAPILRRAAGGEVGAESASGTAPPCAAPDCAAAGVFFEGRLFYRNPLCCCASIARLRQVVDHWLWGTNYRRLPTVQASLLANDVLEPFPGWRGAGIIIGWSCLALMNFPARLAPSALLPLPLVVVCWANEL